VRNSGAVLLALGARATERKIAPLAGGRDSVEPQPRQGLGASGADEATCLSF
jgi:hypothetical protein